MRHLRFVTISEDGSHVLVEPAETFGGVEQFLLPVDATLRDAVRAETPALAGVGAVSAAPVVPTPHEAPREAFAPEHVAPVAARTVPSQPAHTAETGISPREIQVRVRAGESPADIAADHGVPLERIMRFAGPVVEERLRIADEARRARARRTGSQSSTAEPPLVAFGETVDLRFTAHGIEAGEVSWNSRRRDDGDWIVTAQWQRGENTHRAEWLFHRGSRTVTPLDDTAGDLLSDRPIRPASPPPPTRPTLVAAPPLTHGVVAFPPMPDAHTGPIPVIEEVFDQETLADTPVVALDEVADYEMPPLPLGIPEPVQQAEKAAGVTALRNLGTARRKSDDDKGSRPKVPSWDDILLGVRPKD